MTADSRTVERRHLWRMAAMAGVVLGVLYTLSPIAVLAAAALAPMWRWASRGLPARERQWLFGLLAAAVAARLFLLAALFVFADPAQPYATFFGDEELFKQRTVWVRNIGLGVPISAADYIYAFDVVGQSSYLYLLAYLQALVGPAPYGVHVFNAVLYLVAALVLYRFVRPAFGGVPAIGGLAVLLFLPSLFAWSISALKESMFVLVAAGQLVCAVQIVRAPRWSGRVLALGGAVAGAVVLESLRFGGFALAAVGTIAGVAASVILARPRLALVSFVAVPMAAAVLLARPEVQDRLLLGVRQAASHHRGHILTAGYTYQLLEPHYYHGYDQHDELDKLTPSEAAQYVVRAVTSYLTVPLPWRIESRAMLAYLPEQMLWYLMVVLVPFGVLAGLRRDAPLTWLLVSHATAAVMMVALTGGNIGTLVRHRGLALPYLVWLAALGACELARRLMAHERDGPAAPELPRPLLPDLGAQWR
jgi:hypothetical protein